MLKNMDETISEINTEYAAPNMPYFFIKTKERIRFKIQVNIDLYARNPKPLNLRINLEK